MEPVLDLSGFLGMPFLVFVEADVVEAEAAGGARVVGEDPGDDGEALVGVGAEGKGTINVERRGAPEGTPSARDGRRARAVFGGEEGDDGAEDVIGEFADEIPVADELAIPVPRPAPLGRGFRRLLFPLHV